VGVRGRESDESWGWGGVGGFGGKEGEDTKSWGIVVLIRGGRINDTDTEVQRGNRQTHDAYAEKSLLIARGR